MKKIYVCSPYRSTAKDSKTRAMEIRAHRSLANAACTLVAAKGYLPLAPHVFFTGFLDDDVPRERELGLKLGGELLKEADEVWTFGNRVSKGMEKELYDAADLGIPVKNFGLTKEDQNLKDFIDPVKDNGYGFLESTMLSAGESPEFVKYIHDLGIADVLFKASSVSAANDSGYDVPDFENLDDEEQDDHNEQSEDQYEEDGDESIDALDEVDSLDEMIGIMRSALANLEAQKKEKEKEKDDTAGHRPERNQVKGVVIKMLRKE